MGAPGEQSPGATRPKYCVPTYTCDGSVDGSAGVCRKYCCSNADCGGGTCKPFDPNLGTLGACQTLEDGGTSDAGDAEAGGAGGTDGATDASDASDASDAGGAAGSDAAPSDAETDGD